MTLRTKNRRPRAVGQGSADRHRGKEIKIFLARFFKFLTRKVTQSKMAISVHKPLARKAATIRRRIRAPDGLPFTRIGNRTLIHLPTAR